MKSIYDNYIFQKSHSYNHDLISSNIDGLIHTSKIIKSNIKDIYYCETPWGYSYPYFKSQLNKIELWKEWSKYCLKNNIIAEINASSQSILSGERTALNFLQMMSGISTKTNKYSKLLKNSNIELLDTRKTLPGLRYEQKYSTFVGGAKNHRMGLYDKILIKDNHIKVIGGISKTLSLIKKQKIKKFEIECETFEEVKKCINYNCRHILLDNMSIKEIKKCLSLRKETGKKILFEVSGGVNLDNIKQYLLSMVLGL